MNHSSGGEIVDDKRRARDAVIHEERLIQFNAVLLGYISACMNSNNPAYALRALRIFGDERRKKKNMFYINDVSLFSPYLDKLAADADLKSMLEMLKFLRQHQFKLQAQTYAHVLECIGRMKNDDHTKSSKLLGL